MATEEHAASPANGVGLVRDRLLMALHVGHLRPGDRVLSVRRQADMTGVNHKTVHRAYTALAREGLLEVRPGSGTFVSDRRAGPGDLPPTARLLRALDRVRAEAGRLGLSPRVLLRFLDISLGEGLHGHRVGLVECNCEQIAMIGRDLHRSLGIEVKPILLDRLERDARALLADVGSVVTTDCHYSRVVGLIEPHRVSAHTVALDKRFPRFLSKLARDHEIVLVVRDQRFQKVLFKQLGPLSGETDLSSRIRFVDERRAAAELRLAKPGTRVYLSPLVGRPLRHRLPAHVRQVKRCWHVVPSALESVRAGLSLELALGADAR